MPPSTKLGSEMPKQAVGGGPESAPRGINAQIANASLAKTHPASPAAAAAALTISPGPHANTATCCGPAPAIAAAATASATACSAQVRAGPRARPPRGAERDGHAAVL